MKRCALIIADDPKFRDWLGYHVTMQWPKMMIEYARVPNAPLYLDRTEISRYQLIIARLGFQREPEFTTCIFLMRILKLDVHPEIVLIGEDPDLLRLARSTALGAANCLPLSEVSTSLMSQTLAEIAGQNHGNPAQPHDGAPEIPGYTIRKSIAGTYGATVYLAYDEKADREVALKICDLSSKNEGPVHKLTLRQEFETMRRLGGEHVARVYEYGEKDGLGYMSLEYFPRGCVSKVFSSATRHASRVGYLRRVAEALQAIHEAGFLHLDLKPNNVMIRADGSPALIDFGISKRILAARFQENPSYSMGSPYFMSPEQMRGDPLDVRSDIYSFGALWFRIFTGQLPFPGRSFEELRLGKNHPGAPYMGDALKHYQPIIDRTLASSPEQRYGSIQELIDDIDYHFGTATGLHRAPYFKERRKNKKDSAKELRHPDRRGSDGQERTLRHIPP